ncbi:hypothetical protein [Fusobacterium necrophorum]|uniref:hypothetical protein n=1 Tax=Fusobacterium necrophorum TaxID=859 RepID=UPI00254DAA66|nr:hypothetical protein [Fusobacterium necrophorum]MDK4524977.1 hypothetical protein [Fusobacterium necrophorum]
MNKLEIINNLVQKIKLYESKNFAIPVDLYYFEEDKEEFFVSLKIDENYIRFLINKDGDYFIETSLNKFESLDELTFWRIMYLNLKYDIK